MAKLKNKIIRPTKEQLIKKVKSVNSGEASNTAAYTLAHALYRTSEQSTLFNDMGVWVDAIQTQTDELNAGDFSCLVGRLNGHMVLMESAFIKLTLQFHSSNNVEQISKLGTLAMKLQSNMRNTAQTICDLKHPRQQVNFVRAETANLTSGSQQNNIRQEVTREEKICTNELLD